MTKIKICGLRRLQDIEIVNKYKPDFIGFIFWPKSKRYVSLENAKLLKQNLNPDISTVGVFVNESILNIKHYVNQGIIDYIQLHGDEDEEFINQLRRSVNIPIIKAIRVENKEQLIKQLKYFDRVPIDYYLFDTYHKSMYGGIGESFDWELLEKVMEEGNHKPYFLAGGIGIDNLREAMAHKPYAVDLSSKVETNGFKDETKIKELTEIKQLFK